VTAARRSGTRIVPPHAEIAQALMEFEGVGVLLVDPAGRVASVNREAMRLLGLNAARIRGTAAAEWVRTVVAGDDPVGEAFRSARHERETVLLTRAHGEVPVLLRARRVGRPPWVVFTIRDLTQARRMQQELRRHERLATLGQLSAGVAHEIRNPLAGIGTSAQVLLRRFEPRDERARFVTVILDEVGRLDRIVNSLLQYARPRTPDLHQGSITTCIEKVLQLVAEAIEKARVDVEIDVAPRLRPVYIDADLVTQVLLNVSLNAVQAMPHGGRLRYEIRRVRRRSPARGPGRRAGDPQPPASAREGSPPWVEYQQVRVIDTGVGITRGVLSKMFDPFFSTKAGGTGLGLSISQSIMQEHGGSIEVASREKHGTTVLLNFPVEKRQGERRRTDSDP
jgi:PAS domain S-box-containing protein